MTDAFDSFDGIEVVAAGGVVWRRTAAGGIEVLVVHRPRYDDWSLPKGKLEPGETLEACAGREVLEETGLACRRGEVIADVRYRDHKDRAKLVRYWAMEVANGDATSFEANDEVDALAWLPIEEAGPRLTYPHDRPLLEALLTTPSVHLPPP